MAESSQSIPGRNQEIRPSTPGKNLPTGEPLKLLTGIQVKLKIGQSRGLSPEVLLAKPSNEISRASIMNVTDI